MTTLREGRRKVSIEMAYRPRGRGEMLLRDKHCMDSLKIRMSSLNFQ